MNSTLPESNRVQVGSSSHESKRSKIELLKARREEARQQAEVGYRAGMHPLDLLTPPWVLPRLQLDAFGLMSQSDQLFDMYPAPLSGSCCGRLLYFLPTLCPTCGAGTAAQPVQGCAAC